MDADHGRRNALSPGWLYCTTRARLRARVICARRLRLLSDGGEAHRRRRAYSLTRRRQLDWRVVSRQLDRCTQPASCITLLQPHIRIDLGLHALEEAQYAGHSKRRQFLREWRLAARVTPKLRPPIGSPGSATARGAGLFATQQRAHPGAGRQIRPK